MIVTPAPYHRNRPWLAVAIVLVIGIGLASRKFPSYFPSAFGSHTGDALWALMVFLGIAYLFPKMGRSTLTLAALALAYLVEAGQLYQAPWINQIRATTLGHLILGTGFQWLDLVAYAIGIAAGLLGDLAIAWRARKKRKESARKRSPAPLPARRFQGWKSSQTEQCISWWNADHQTHTEDWRTFTALFLFIFGCFMTLLLIVVVFAILLAGVEPVFTRKGNMFGDDLEILWGILILSPLLSAYMARGCCNISVVFRFDIDLKAEKIILHETRFPNRSRLALIPFSKIVHVRPRRMTRGGVAFEVRYEHDEGQSVEVGLGDNFHLRELEAQLDLMRPALGDKVLEVYEYHNDD